MTWRQVEKTLQAEFAPQKDRSVDPGTQKAGGRLRADARKTAQVESWY